MKILVLIILIFSTTHIQAKGKIFKLYSARGDMSVSIIPQVASDQVTEDAKTHIYTPNVSNVSGVTIGYKGLSVSYGSTNPISDNAKVERGSTKYNDFQFHFFRKKFGLDLIYQTFKGLHRSSASDAEKTDEEGGVRAFPKLPNMEVKKFAANLYYVRTPNDYSIPAAFEQTDRQTKSGGSLIGMLSASDVNISNKGEAIIPVEQQVSFGSDGGFSGARMKSLSLGVGGGYTLVLAKSFFLTGQLIIGKAYQRFKGNGIRETGEQDIQASTQNIRASAGYNGQRFFIGLMFINDRVSTETDTLIIEPESRYNSLYIGYRW